MDIDMHNSFWQRCVKARCVVAPVHTYVRYGDDGNTHLDDSVGVRYVAFRFDNEAVGPHYFVMIDDQKTGIKNIFLTPEDALDAYEQNMDAVAG